jgi:hypothetical protein
MNLAVKQSQGFRETYRKALKIIWTFRVSTQIGQAKWIKEWIREASIKSLKSPKGPPRHSDLNESDLIRYDVEDKEKFNLES